jgi:WNK lysine deficient protein kinase
LLLLSTLLLPADRNVMRLYDWWYDRQGQVLVFITELLTDGSLRRFIRRKHAAGITLSALKRYAWQILQGLVYLHGHYPPIIHRWVRARGRVVCRG